jgi:RNA polymerase sigma factor for flagellar operon FliA
MPSKKHSAKSTRKSPARERAKGAARPAKGAPPAAKEKVQFKQGALPQRAPLAAPEPEGVLPRRAAPKHAAKKPKGPRSSMTVAELRELPTEEIWSYYRKAIHERPRKEEWVERLRNALMELYYPLVRHIAERLLQTLPKSIELDDLVSAGLFGLMDAIRGFDPDRGIKFKTYCTTRIRGSILDQLRSQDWVPRLVRLKASRIEKALHKLQGEYGREPTHAELAEALRMDHAELSTEISSARAKTMYSLSERWDDRDDDGSMEKVEIVEDKDAIDPIGELNRRDVMNYITRSLTHKERFIIEQYYQVGHTMREIGEMLALTESRVCQIHSNVMSRLKSLLGPGASGLVP